MFTASANENERLIFVKHERTSAKTSPLSLLIAVAGTCGLLLTAGCASTKQDWLTFFFDGVPPATGPASTVVVVANKSNAPVVATAPAPVKPKPPQNIRHQPFAEGKCVQCHGDIGFSPKVTAPLRQLCFTCHKDFVTPMKVKHQPVEDGDCLSCHLPHESPNKNLLTKKPNQLCGECHDDLAKKKVVHQPVADGDCLACHVPHAGNLKHLVTKTVPALCFDCHDNFLTKAKFTHDAVEDCTACHNPHSTGEKALLKKDIVTLCADCHEAKDIAAVKGHADIGTQSCIACHDPHVGTNKNLLKAGKVPAATNGGAP